jgi:predicted nuclease of restriction endonuclease-like (RecB) superfamily
VSTVRVVVSRQKGALVEGYASVLAALKARIQQERLRVVITANSAVVMLYWDIGRSILERQSGEGWGAKVIDRLARDLAAAFPDMRGFSPRNLKYMRAFAAAWPDRAIVQAPLAQLSWYHHISLLERLDSAEARLWYARKAVDHGWSRNVMVLQIERRADFLGTADPRREREIEQGLVDHIQRFLLELGAGFAFVGRQVHLEVGGHDFYVDLLFFHLKLRCFVVIELKAGEFDAAYVGQLNLYLSAVDDLLRHADDKPTIGLLLCRSKNAIVVEYALRDLRKPIGVAGWETRIVESLPAELEGSLPTVEEIEAELAKSR